MEQQQQTTVAVTVKPHTKSKTKIMSFHQSIDPIIEQQVMSYEHGQEPDVATVSAEMGAKSVAPHNEAGKTTNSCEMAAETIGELGIAADTMDETPKNPLGIIFDIDGSLIAESRHIRGIRIRPGAVEFIEWCKERGHAVAIWTKAHWSWANSVATKFCLAIHPNHICKGRECRATFDFCWDGSQLRRQKHPRMTWQAHKQKNSNLGDGCRWCEAYSNQCHQCECHINYMCPCQEVKDLRKVWYDSSDKTQRFFKERTLIVEDTPQNCIYNYGNAIYVPTYRGSLIPDEVFERLQMFIEEVLEPCENVRQVQKCNHGPSYHACFEQSWMSHDLK